MKHIASLVFIFLVCNTILPAQSGCEVRGLGGNWVSGPAMTGNPPTVTTNVGSRTDYKIYCSSNNTWYPGGDNAWTNGGGDVLFTLDGGGRALAGEVVVNFSLCAPGAFSGWNNSSGMTQNGNQWCYTVPNPGTYQWKPTRCGAWDSWEPWNGQRSVDSDNWTITTNTPNQTFCINYFPTTGAVSTAFLPVTWQDFFVEKGEKGHVLTWSTAAEVNNDYFDVLFSQDGKEFTPVGRVAGSGTKDTETRYSFTYEKVGMGFSFYKIRQVDFDGKASYSDVRFVKDESNVMTVYPYSGTGLFYMQGLPDSGIEWQVFDQSGRLLLQQTNYTLPYIDISSFIPGLYIVSINAGGNVQRFKVIKI